MKCLVLLKEVPNVASIRIDPETFTVDRDNVINILDPADLNAIEAALTVASGPDDETVAMSMGPESADAVIRTAIAMGIKKGVRITDDAFAGADSLVTATVLKAAIDKEGPFDVIFCGAHSVDGATGQIAGKLGAMLGIGTLHELAKDRVGGRVRPISIRFAVLIKIVQYRPGIVHFMTGKTVTIIPVAKLERLVCMTEICCHLLDFRCRKAHNCRICCRKQAVHAQIVETGKNTFFCNAQNAREDGKVKMRICLECQGIKAAEKCTSWLIITMRPCGLQRRVIFIKKQYGWTAMMRVQHAHQKEQ